MCKKKIANQKPSNGQIANHLLRIATMMELAGDPIYKIRSYRLAAEQVLLVPDSVAAITRTGQIRTVSGVGPTIGDVIVSFVETGSSGEYDMLSKQLPIGYLELLKVHGFGPKHIIRVFQELGVQTLDELESACKHHKLQTVTGIGPKTEARIMQGIQIVRAQPNRFLLGSVLPYAEIVIQHMVRWEEIQLVSIVGSVRRMCETVGNINILAAVEKENFEYVIRKFDSLPWNLGPVDADAVGANVSMQLGYSEIPVSLRMTSKPTWGISLIQFTGSKEHVAAIGSRISNQRNHMETGIDDLHSELIAVQATESAFYKYFELPWIAPELRENRGEIEAADKEALPNLIQFEDIKGDLHVHTNWSDGARSIQEMVEYARSLKYHYLAITDHSRSLTIAHGLSIDKLRRQREEIAQWNERYDDIVIFAGTEMDILPDGSLDYPDSILMELDFVIASIHSAFQLSQEKQTKRLIAAMKNPYVHMIGHPSGRLLSRRTGYELDWDRLFQTACETGTMLEINSSPNRLDLKDSLARRAGQLGIPIAVNTDAHDFGEFHFIRYGIATARRAWLEKKHVMNTYSLDHLRTILQKKRKRAER